ncbi:MAG TPA: PIG-L family deacetylase [Chloroflexota bacterium]|jgi:N-acetyl-1-D-myo-inositol-2-amino-2-deoxy-alpha-D-glucopyranoside deacetylase|nr:PIG-L family deacetylase [Chloroflexota bacterium]
MPTLMAVYAHPDDEAFAGGVLARYAQQGVRTVLVTTTGGEAGEISDPTFATQENLGEVRAAELAEAARVLGIHRTLALGYRDSGMAGTPENDDPRSLHRADPDEATGRLVAVIRAERPQVLITHNEQGDYGHPDHVKTHRVVVAAFAAAGDPARFPEAGPAWAPSKLYIGAFPRSGMARWAESLRELGIEPPIANREFKDTEGRPVEFGTPDELITTEVDVADFVDLKRQAMLAHRTQFGPEHFLMKIPAEHFGRIWTTEWFRLLVGQRGGDPDAHERDLFAGL